MSFRPSVFERDDEQSLWVHISPEYIFSAHFTPEAAESGSIMIHEPVDETKALVFAGQLDGGVPADDLAAEIRAILRRSAREGLARIAAAVDRAVWRRYGGRSVLNGVLARFYGESGLLEFVNASIVNPLHVRMGDQLKAEFVRGAVRQFGCAPDRIFVDECAGSLRLEDEDLVTFATPKVLELSNDLENPLDWHQRKIIGLCREICANRKRDYVHQAEIPFRLVEKMRQNGPVELARQTVIFAFVKTRISDRRIFRTVPLAHGELDRLCVELGDFVERATGNGELRARADLLLGEFLTNVCAHEKCGHDHPDARLTVAVGVAEEYLRIWIWQCAACARKVASATLDSAENQLDRCNETMSASGRGLAIIRKLSDYISIKRFANLTRYCFHLPLEPRAEFRGGGVMAVDDSQLDRLSRELEFRRSWRASFRRIFKVLAWRLAIRATYAVKRALDCLLSALAIVLLSPVWLLIALAVKLCDRGPVFFTQIRVGQNGRHFDFWKFRSMYVDAEARKAQLLARNQSADGVIFKMKDDPRITPVGKWLRRTSLDELPQLWNVLKGDMSLVGPRPPLPSEVAQYGVDDLKRLDVRPGITCLWQISGRSEIPFRRQVELDKQYIDSHGLWSDLKILAKTIPAILSGRGAY